MIPTVLLFQVQELFQLATGFGDSFRFQVSPLLISKRSQDNTADLGEKNTKSQFGIRFLQVITCMDNSHVGGDSNQ